MAYRKTNRRTPRKAAGRKTRRTTTKVNRQWTREEVAFMRKYYRKFETAWCARQLRRSVYSVRYKAVDLNLKKATPSVWRGNKGPANAFRSFGKPTPTRKRTATRGTTKTRTWRASSKKRNTTRKPKTRRTR